VILGARWTDTWWVGEGRYNNAYGGPPPRLFGFGDDGNNFISLYAGSTDGTFTLERKVAGSSVTATSQVEQWDEKSSFDLVASWDSSGIKVSVKGHPFISSSQAISPVFAAALFDIGANYDGSNPIAGDVLWFACGKGTLVDADAATLNAFGDAGPPDLSTLTAGHPAATATAFWPADTTFFDTPSPYYPNVLPMRRVRSSAVIGATSYPVFTAFIDTERGWERQETTPGYAEITVPGNDGFDILSTARLTASDSFPLQKSGARITAVLDAIGWPAAERDIDTGQEDVQAVAAPDANTDALSLIQAAADTEPGFFFIDERGYAVYHDRHRRLFAPYTVSQATFCDGPNMDTGRFEYARLQTKQSRILNDIRVTGLGLAEQTALDAASVVRFRQRTDPLSTLHTSIANALASASWRLSQTANSYVRYEELELQPGADADIWTQVLARKIGDRITIIRTPPGGGEVETKDCHIEAVSLDVGPATNAKCVWRLSPAEQSAFWAAAVGGFSNAGTTTRAVY